MGEGTDTLTEDETMFHKSNFGRFADNLSQYADRNGYVPQEGDDWRDMDYELGPDAPSPDDSEEERREKIEYLDEEWWPEHVERAVEATEQAKQSLEEWRS